MASSTQSTYIGITVVAMVLVLGLALGYWFWSKSDTSSKSTNPSSHRSSPSRGTPETSKSTPTPGVGDNTKFLSGTQLKKFIRDDMGHLGRIRLIGPNTMVTTDHDPTRVNIMTERDDPSSAVIEVDLF